MTLHAHRPARWRKNTSPDRNALQHIAFDIGGFQIRIKVCMQSVEYWKLTRSRPDRTCSRILQDFSAYIRRACMGPNRGPCRHHHTAPLCENQEDSKRKGRGFFYFFYDFYYKTHDNPVSLYISLPRILSYFPIWGVRGAGT